MITRSGSPTRDPVPEVGRLANLANRILGGDIVLPKFQRSFTWTRDQVLALLDSVALNYPIGSVLLWQSTATIASEQTIADLPVRPPRPGYPVNYILDGQQRLSTICGAMHWNPGKADSIWNIVYDLAEQKFLHRATLNDPPPQQVPVRLLSDPSEYFMRIAEVGDPELTRNGKRLFDRFNDYLVASVVLRDMSIDEVAKVFGRINSTGTPLDVVDLVRALTWRPDFDLTDEIDSLLSVLAEKRYGKVDRKTILRTIAATAGLGFSREDMDRLSTLSRAELADAVAVTAAAARRAVDFLTTQVKTPRAAALPHLNQFAVLVEIFRQVPRPTTLQLKAIHRWFWLTASGGYFKGWNAAQMATDITAIEAFAKRQTSNIAVPAAVPRSSLWRQSPFRQGSAPAKLLALLLAYAEPLDLRTGQRIDVDKALSWDNDKEFHHFFPRDYLKGERVPASEANVCANIIMLTSATNIWITNRRPSNYLRDLCETEGEQQVRHRARTCLVDDDAFAAALRDDYSSFLRARSETLHRRFTDLLGPSEAHAGVAAADLPDDGPALDIDEPVDRDSAD